MSKKFKLISALLALVLLVSFSVACTGDSDEGTIKKGSGEATSTTEQGTQDKQNLAVGDTYEIRDLAVTVTAIEPGGKNYDDKELIKVSVSYENKSDKSASFNTFDWEVQDANGARTDSDWSVDDQLGSGNLAPGGTKAGAIYFLAENAAKIVYTNNFILDDEESIAMWNVGQ